MHGTYVDEWMDSLLPAGKRVPAGCYRRVDVPIGRTVVLAEEDWLPASMDGRVALYLPMAERPWTAKSGQSH